MSDVARIEQKIEAQKVQLGRTLDRLDSLSDDALDTDERAYYEQRRENIKHMLADLRAEHTALLVRGQRASISHETLSELMELGEAHRAVLERTDLDFATKRALVDSLDVRGSVGMDERGRYVDFSFCGTTARAYVHGDSNGSVLRSQ